MLHLAVMLNRLESVKLLLEYGADPSAKNLDGQTPLLLLNLGLSLVGTAPWLLIQAITLLSTKMLFDQDQASAIRELLEERGSRDKDMVDDISSRNEIEKIISNFKSGPRIGETIGKMINTWGNTPFDKFMKSDNPFARKMRSIDDKYVFWALCQALLEWDAKRKEGSISKDELPDGWSDFFEEWNRETKGSLTQWMQDNQIPEITKILKGMAVSACEWAVDKNVPDILAYVTMMVSESMRTGAFGELVTHGSAAAAILFGLFQSPELFSFTMKVLFLQRLKKLWKAMKKGELLDILHDLVVRLGMCEAFDNISEVLVLSHLKTGPKPPILLVEDLSLPTRYPGSAVFVTSTNHYPAFVRVALTLIELFIFLFPLSYLLVVLYCLFHATIYEATWKVCLAYHAISAIPDSWVCCDENFRLHPNIPRGMQAAWELILFRLRHGFPAEEPFIISFRANSQHHVDIPTRMASMYKGALWPLYWLPLRRDAVVMPVPCYSAMRVLLSRWKKGRLPRKAWGDGWWELLDGKGRIWKRVNLKERPTWSEYTKASEEIQVRVTRLYF
jgi:hypothetical protein